jgi:hypothetical protein
VQIVKAKREFLAISEGHMIGLLVVLVFSAGVFVTLNWLMD